MSKSQVLVLGDRNGGGAGREKRRRMGKRGVPGHRIVSGQQAGVVCPSLTGQGRQLMGLDQAGIHQTTVVDGHKENEGGDRGEIGT